MLPDSENQRGQPTRAGDSGCVVCARKEAKDPNKTFTRGKGGYARVTTAQPKARVMG